MSRLLILSLFLALFTRCTSQPGPVRREFDTLQNGLMYSDNDMKSLRFIVDSLNLRFKACDLNKAYYAYPQTHSYYIRFVSESNDLTPIITDLHKVVPFRALVEKYSALVKTSDSARFIIRTEKEKYMSGKPGKGYSTLSLSENVSFENVHIKGRWVYDYSIKGQYTNYYSLDCYFFPSDWQRRAIPDEYARLIQYVDCMIDTSAYIFLTDNYTGVMNAGKNGSHYNNIEPVAKYIDQKMGKKSKRIQKELTDKQMDFAIKGLSDDATFKAILAKTIDDYVSHKTADYQLESLATELGLYDKALLMKRSYRVIGGCSQDESPRLHARDIAVLAARSHSWDIFLRSHLDIMNDRFDRMSDGSYAWGQRKTYLRELEDLNLNIVDLMLGLTLRADNVADNHYYGTIWRIGWALTESKEKPSFEQKAIAMMKDDRLDEFNRGLVFLLYSTYINYLGEKESTQKIVALKENIALFPAFIQSSIAALDTESKQRERR